MKYHPEEFFPERKVAWAVVQEDLQNLIKPFEEQVERPLCVSVFLCAGEEETELGNVSGSAIPDDQNAPVGKLKLRFRRTYREDRVLYCAHALYEPDVVLPGSGFSGFKASGAVLLKNVEPFVEPKGAKVHLYNEYSWTGWFW